MKITIDRPNRTMARAIEPDEDVTVHMVGWYDPDAAAFPEAAQPAPTDSLVAASPDIDVERVAFADWA